MSDAARETQFTPWITNGGWTYWPLGRILIALSGVIAAAISVPVGLLPYGLGVALICGLLIIRSPKGRQFMYHTVAEFFRNRREARIAKKRGPYRTRELREVLYPDDDEITRRQKVDPVQPNIIPIDGGKGGFLTEIHTPLKNAHTLHLTAGGFASALRDPEDAVDTGEAFANVLKAVDREYDLSGLSAALFFERRPTNAQSNLEFLEKRLATDDGDAFARSVENLMERTVTQIDTTGDFVSGAAICLPRPRAWNRAKSLETLATKDILSSPIFRTTEMLRTGLASIGATDVMRPNPFETALLIRGSLDVARIHELYLDYHKDAQRQQSGEMKSFSDSLLMQGGILPDDWSPHRTYLRVGDTFTRMFFVTQYPDREVMGGLMRSLFESREDIWYGLSTVYRTLGTKGERHRNRLRRLVNDAKRVDRARRGTSSTAEQDAIEASMNQADTLLHYSGGRVMQMTLLPYVSAGSAEGLEQASMMLKRIFREVNLPLQMVSGRSLQVPVRLATLGINTESV